MATFTNFWCRSGGSNAYAGTLLGDATVPGTTPFKTYTAGNWVNATRVFTPVSGTPNVDLTVGQFVNVGGTFIGRISAVSATTFTVDATSQSGTNPVNGTYDANIGGAWLGPSGADGFPFSFNDIGDLRNSSNNQTCLNFINDQTYAPTAQWNLSNATNTPRFRGSDSSGNEAIALIQGPSTGASFIVLNITGNGGGVWLDGFDFQRNGSTGNATGVNGANLRMSRCSFRDMKGAGLTHAGNYGTFDNCQFDNNVGLGFSGGSDTYEFTTCSFTRNAGGGASSTGVIILHDCTAANNTGVGVNSGTIRDYNGNYYNNSTYGASYGSGSGWFTNCNFLKNTSGSINSATGAQTALTVRNCGVGSGTQANGTGFPTTCTLVEIGTITYASGVTPWVDPANGNFTTNLAAAEGTGYGAFLNQASGYGGTLNYPNVGASQQAAVTPGALMRSPGTQGGISS